MPPTPDAPFDPDDSVGAILRRMRQAKKLSGRQLGDLVGMSQPKISRLERSDSSPDPRDVERVARALDAPDDLIARLVDLAGHAPGRARGWQTLPSSLAGRQRNVREIESDVKTMLAFQPLVIPGLLQTSEYARAVLTGFQHVNSPDREVIGSAAVAEAVSGRLARQEILADPSRRFHFVMLESVLESEFYPPEYMPAQIQRIREVAMQDNVTVGVIAKTTKLLTLPMNGFVLADDSMVVIDLLNTSIWSEDRHDVAVYRQAFEEYAQAAEGDLDALLDRHVDHYLRAMQQHR